MKNIKTIALSLAIGVLLAGGATYAWSTNIWNGTDWMSSGSVINAQLLGENMEYLYAKIGELESGGNEEISAPTCVLNTTHPAPICVGGLAIFRGCYNGTYKCPEDSVVSNISVRTRTEGGYIQKVYVSGVQISECTKYTLVCGGIKKLTTPGSYTWVVPEGVTSVDIDLAGGGGSADDDAGDKGQNGGHVTGKINVTPGETINITVGEVSPHRGSGLPASLTGSFGTISCAGGAGGYKGGRNWIRPYPQCSGALGAGDGGGALGGQTPYARGEIGWLTISW